MTSTQAVSELKAEISRLQTELSQLRSHSPLDVSLTALSSIPSHSSASSLHALLLLSDSALPLSAFAFSSGLESYLAHHSVKPRTSSSTPTRSIPTDKLNRFLPFLRQSLASLARGFLPFVLAAFDVPSRLVEWDDTCDASTLCNVARRQSVEQGRALLAVWMRGLHRLAFQPGVEPSSSKGEGEEESSRAARCALLELDSILKHPKNPRMDGLEMAHGHLAPLFGAVARAAGIGRQDVAYVFLLNHAKSLVSAAVRAGVCGPFRQQELLASRSIREMVEQGVMEGKRVYETYGLEGTGQVVGMLDIWQGRHEVLYSRVFNS